MKLLPTISLGLAGSILLGITTAAPGWAEFDGLLMAQTNQSDVSGTGVGDIPAPTLIEGIGFEGGDGQDWDGDGDVDGDDASLYDAAVARARDLASQLDDAYAACEASRDAIAQVPRRFGRGPAPHQLCTSPACEQLDQLVREARLLLSRLNGADREFLERAGIQLW